MICRNCGNTIPDGSPFCAVCGAPQTVYQPYAGGGAERTGIPAPGFSDRAEHPEILAAVKKNKNAAKIFALILVPLPLIGFIIYALVSKKMEIGSAALYGGIISAVFLLFALISFIRSSTKKSYDAVVTDKKSYQTYRHSNSSNDRDMITEYKITALTDDGRKKKIVEREGSLILAYNYLNVGDRFRYHPQFNFPYELYDKSRAPYIMCVSCGTKNATADDRCSKCGLPLLK